MRCVGLQEPLQSVRGRVLGPSLCEDLDRDVRIRTSDLSKNFRCDESSSVS